MSVAGRERKWEYYVWCSHVIGWEMFWGWELWHFHSSLNIDPVCSHSRKKKKIYRQAVACVHNKFEEKPSLNYCSSPHDISNLFLSLVPLVSLKSLESSHVLTFTLLPDYLSPGLWPMFPTGFLSFSLFYTWQLDWYLQNINMAMTFSCLKHCDASVMPFECKVWGC